MPLTPGLPSNDCPLPLSLCGSAIPRNHGTCDHVLSTTAGSESDQSKGATVLPLSLVPDLTTDPRFSSKPYCQFDGSSQFYAAVPIRTCRGINIGSYCVLNPSQPATWDDQCPRRLNEISHAIMEHLESNRTRYSHRRNERMNRGLGSFIEGEATISGWQSRPNQEAFTYNAKLEGALDVNQQHLERQGRGNKEEEQYRQAGGLMTPTVGSLVTWNSVLAERPHTTPDADFFGHLRKGSGRGKVDSPATVGDAAHTEGPNPGENGPRHVFSKAANIIRESFEVEGCVFFDVTLGSYRAPAVHSPLGEPDSDGLAVQLSTASSSDEQVQVSPVEEPDSSCELLSFSTTEASSINVGEIISSGGIVPKKLLAKLLRRYPNGKIFNFDAVGELLSSDSSEDDGTLLISMGASEPTSTHENTGGATPGSAPLEQSDGRFSRLKEAALIHQAFPSARSVAFIAIWDPRKE